MYVTCDIAKYYMYVMCILPMIKLDSIHNCMLPMILLSIIHMLCVYYL